MGSVLVDVLPIFLQGIYQTCDPSALQSGCLEHGRSPPVFSLFETASDVVHCLGWVDKIRLVHDKEISYLCEPCFESLNLITQLRHKHHYSCIHGGSNLNLCLSRANRLDYHRVHTRSVEYSNCVPRGPCEPPD